MALIYLHRLALRKPKSIIVLTFTFILLTLGGLPHLRTVLALEEMVEKTFPGKAELDLLNKEYKLGNAMNLVIERPAAGWNEALLCDIHKWLSTERRAGGRLKSSISPFEIRRAASLENRLTYPRLLDLSCLTDSPKEALSPDQLDAAFEAVHDSPWGLSLTGDGKILAVEMNLADAGKDSRTGKFSPAAVAEIHAGFAREISAVYPDLRAFWVGPSDFQYFLYKGLTRVNILNLILMAALLIGMWLIFGSWKAGILFLLSTVAASLSTFGLMGAFGVPVDILNKGLFLIVTVAALEDFLYLCAQTQNAGPSWRRPFRQLLLPGFLTSFTTAIGFGSLIISDIEIIRRFGFWSALAGMIEWFLIFITMPAMFKLWPWMRMELNAKPSWILRHISSLKILGIPRRFALASLIVFPLAIVGIFHLKIKDIPLEMFPKDHRFRIGVSMLEARAGYQGMASLVFPPETDEPARSKIIAQVNQLPNIRRAVDPGEIFGWIAENVDEKPRRDLIRAEVETPDIFPGIFNTHGGSRAPVYLKLADTHAVAETTEAIGKICGTDCDFVGAPVLYSRFSNLVPKTLLESFVLSLGLVILILAWVAFAQGRGRALPALVLSSFWGTSLMFLIISVLGIKVNFLTCVFASILVGLTGDNAIQFLLSGRGTLGKGILMRGEGALLCGMLMAACSVIFVGSYFVPPRIFGLLLAGGFFMSTLGDYWILRALIREEKDVA